MKESGAMGTLTLRYTTGNPSDLEEHETEIEMLPDETVLEAAHRNGIMIPTTCSGHAACARCVCYIRSGIDDIVGKDHYRPSANKNEDSTAMTCQMQISDKGNVTISTY